MKETMENRILKLKDEFESGRKMMIDMEQKQARLREQLFRISGAIQVLEEILAESETIPGANIKEFKVSGANG